MLYAALPTASMPWRTLSVTRSIHSVLRFNGTIASRPCSPKIPKVGLSTTPPSANIGVYFCAAMAAVCTPAIDAMAAEMPNATGQKFSAKARIVAVAALIQTCAIWTALFDSNCFLANWSCFCFNFLSDASFSAFFCSMKSAICCSRAFLPATYSASVISLLA